jgi:hypothetical protein
VEPPDLGVTDDIGARGVDADARGVEGVVDPFCLGVIGEEAAMERGMDGREGLGVTEVLGVALAGVVADADADAGADASRGVVTGAAIAAGATRGVMAEDETPRGVFADGMERGVIGAAEGAWPRGVTGVLWRGVDVDCLDVIIWRGDMIDWDGNFTFEEDKPGLCVEAEDRGV